jgi:hypothetical protein
VSLLLANSHKQDIANLSTLAISEVNGVFDLLKGRPIPEYAYQMRLALPAIADTYSGAAEILALDYYDESRALAPALKSNYSAAVGRYSATAEVSSAIGYSVARLTKQAPESNVLGMLAGAMQRAVANADRETVSYNIVLDPDGTVYERIPQSDACAFCLTMAAVAEVQSESFMTKYHDYCRCVTMPIFTGQSRTELPIYGQTREAYNLAGQELQTQRREVGYNSLKKSQAIKRYPELALTTENHLRGMRQITGWN